MNKPELKLKYKELKRAGKEKEAQKILEKIWAMTPTTPKPTPKKPVKQEEELIVPEKELWHDNYLNQNTKTVIKSLKNDDFDKKDLQILYNVEKAEKRRKKVINVLKQQLED